MTDERQPLSDPRHAPAATPLPHGQQIDHPGLTSDLDPAPDHGESSYVGTARLSGRRALVTGGDSGIGRAVAIAFAREGADVAITHLGAETDDARDTLGHIEDADVKGLTIEADLRDPSKCRQVVDDTVAAFGGVDLVVNNAAYQMAVERFEDLTADQLTRTFTTNVFATVWVCQAAVAHLEPGSAIINTTSIQATDPTPQLIDYAATKAALVNFTKSLGTELAPKGVRVNSVAPGPFWTPLIPATMPSEKVDGFGSETPLGRPGQPAEIAGAYVFLASDDSRYVTGETLSVTGGRLTP